MSVTEVMLLWVGLVVVGVIFFTDGGAAILFNTVVGACFIAFFFAVFLAIQFLLAVITRGT